ncbi:phosphatases II [Myriangium duriaei CBS 260.36]|uniref:Phosphatases II n=1 Tax=Myriangium duriaei CBS 260.36 TaxID=1168546 RepID=A0A9P4J2B7_9PEZI|nr:phosphatases II [Myriangium duriaei CBS 260.36]
MMASPRSYTATSSSTRLPSPPRIAVPSPIIDSAGRLTTSIPYAFPHSPNNTAQVSTSGSLDWKYSSRHTAQQLLPTLMLGPTRVAKDATFLLSNSITLTIGFRPSDEPYARAAHEAVSRICAAHNIASLSISASSHQDLIHEFPRVTREIQSHLSAAPDRVVLLHCENGNERSACAAAAYLISALQDTDHVRAMTLVQSQRFSANFDEDRKRLMQSYWDIVQAERAVKGSVGGAKRARAEMDVDSGADEEDVDMDDVERFGGRSFVPFVDAAGSIGTALEGAQQTAAGATQ